MRQDREIGRGRLLIYRHGLAVRITHWINVAGLLILLLSGLQILSAHPAFYLGKASRFAHPLAAIESVTTPDGAVRGQLRIFGRTLDTTGLLGASRDGEGQLQARVFPAWATLPSEHDLGAGRRWHFFFAWIFVLNGVAYLAQGIWSGRLRSALIPTAADLRNVGHSVVEHARLRFPRGEEARRYNVLQKLSYLPVIVALLPLMALTGLAMSPTMDARFHLLTEVFGGRQSARTLHFCFAATIVLFVVVHVAMVLLAGPINEMRSMITGWFAIRPKEGLDER